MNKQKFLPENSITDCSDSDELSNSNIRDTKIDQNNLVKIVSDMRVDILKILMLLQNVTQTLDNHNKKINNMNLSVNYNEDLVKITNDFDSKLENMKHDIQNITSNVSIVNQPAQNPNYHYANNIRVPSLTSRLR